MTQLNLHKRIFVPVKNSDEGTVGPDTIFIFRQQGQQIFANYSGGSVKDGHLLGIFETPTTARLVYHCMTKSEVLKTGQANARFTQAQNGQLSIDMDWQWLSGDEGKGLSRYEELKHESQP